jgi:hypothetical protein
VDLEGELKAAEAAAQAQAHAHEPGRPTGNVGRPKGSVGQTKENVGSDQKRARGKPALEDKGPKFDPNAKVKFSNVELYRRLAK